MKKIISFVLLIVMLCLTVSSCAESSSLMSFMPEDWNETNFDGTVLKFAWAAGLNSQADYQPNTPQYDFFIEKLQGVEETLNLSIDFADRNNVRMDVVKLDMMAGAPSFDIIIAGGSGDYAKAGYLNSFNDFTDYVDITDAEKFGNIIFQESNMYNGKIYCATPIQWPGFEPMDGYVIAYNRDLFKENGLTDLHEYYENGTWTYDTFENEFFAKTNIQDSDGNPMKLFLTHESNFYQALLHSNQVKFIEEESNGELRANPYSQSFMNAMNWGENLIDTYRDKINFEDTYDITSYRNGSNLTSIAYTNAFITGNIAYNDLGEFESGIMPFPCGPDAVYGEWTSCRVRTFGFMVPVTSPHPEASFTVIDLLSTPYEQFGGEGGLLEYYKQNIFVNELDAEIFVAISEHVYCTYVDSSGGLGGKVRQGFQDVLFSGNRSVPVALDQYRDILTEIIEDWMIPNYNAVYGDAD